MQRSNFPCWAFIFLLFVLSASCSEGDTSVEPDNSTTDNGTEKIMPLGASRVEGARPSYESFRFELWLRLVEAGIDFDYIGSQKDDAFYPDQNGQEFDRDHEGRGGYTSAQIRAGLKTWLEQAGTPDIVLFSSPGGNDALQGKPYDGVIENIHAIIDILQESNPDVTILIEELAPAHSMAMTPALKSYFEKIQVDVPKIAEEQTTATSAVISVNMHEGFKDVFFADPVHYNISGARFIAEQYFQVLDSLMN
jgi:lysophospholipase L1-like esterase